MKIRRPWFSIFCKSPIANRKLLVVLGVARSTLMARVAGGGISTRNPSCFFEMGRAQIVFLRPQSSIIQGKPLGTKYFRVEHPIGDATSSNTTRSIHKRTEVITPLIVTYDGPEDSNRQHHPEHDCERTKGAKQPFPTWPFVLNPQFIQLTRS